MWTCVQEALDNSNQSNVAFFYNDQLVVMSLSFKVFVLFSSEAFDLVDEGLHESKIREEC